MYLCFCASYLDEFFFVFNVFWVREFIPTNHKIVTFTNDLETQGHVMMYVTFTNFGCVCPRTMDFFLFLMLLGSGNPFQQVTNAWLSQMTLKRKVTWCCTWPLLTLAVFVLERWNFFVSNVLWVRESIPTSHKCVTPTDDLETQGHVMLYVTFTNFGCACAILMNFFLFLMFFGSGNPFQLVTNAWPPRMTLKLKVTWCYTWPLLTLAVFVLERWIFFCF